MRKMKLQQTLNKIIEAGPEPKPEPTAAVPKALEPYVNKYGDNVEEFRERYDELK